jgi:hypothetical protein
MIEYIKELPLHWERPDRTNSASHSSIPFVACRAMIGLSKPVGEIR